MAAKIDDGVCTGCGECIGVCPADAISSTNGSTKVDAELCAECGGCVDACPAGAITLKEDEVKGESIPGEIKQSEQFREWKEKRRADARIPNKVKVTIVNMKAGCSLGFKPGDSWILEPTKTPTGMCAQVYQALHIALVTMGFGGEFPFMEKDVTWYSCPDPNRQVIYEIRRLDEKILPPKSFINRKTVG